MVEERHWFREQTEDGKTTRNDRLIAVAAHARDHKDLQSLDQLNDNLLDEIEHFFISYNAAKGKEFAPKGRFGPDTAKRVIDEGVKLFRKRNI